MRITRTEEKNYKLVTSILYHTRYEYGEYTYAEEVDVNECTSLSQCVEKAFNQMQNNSPSLFEIIKKGVSIELYWKEENNDYRKEN